VRSTISLLVPLLVLAACSDSDGSGTEESEVDVSGPFEVEACMHSETWDYDEDGSPDWLSITTMFPGLDALISNEQDVDNDGAWDFRYQGTVLADGRWATQEYDEDGNGIPEEVLVSTYAGNTQYIEVSNALGNVVRTASAVTDESRGTERYEADEDADGDIDYVTESEYDEQDRLIRTEYDLDADGEVDAAVICVYTGDEFVCEELDDAGDAVSMQEHRYDAAEDLWVHTYDLGLDGDLDYERHYRVDEQERFILDRLDEDGNGIFELDVTQVWEGDNLIEKRGYHGTGVNREWVDDLYTYDERGFEVAHVREFRFEEGSRIRATYTSETVVDCEDVTHVPYP